MASPFGDGCSTADMHFAHDSDSYADLGINYPQGALDIAVEQGWDGQEHLNALLVADEDAITLTHPINWLSEEESERYFTNETV